MEQSLKHVFENEEKWFMWPLLPIKKKDFSLADMTDLHKNLGFIFASNKTRVYPFNIAVFLFEGIPPKRYFENFIDYPDVEAMEADGWMVDD
jgi:hypothetical protein